MNTADEYAAAASASVLKCSFSPGDGVNTSFTANLGSVRPDYAAVHDEDTGTVSRWFVIECTRLCVGQFRLTLRRDVVADFSAEVFNAPAFIRRGWLPRGSLLTLAKEPGCFNQIKRAEELLKDDIGMPWLVLYHAAQNNEGGEMVLSGRFKARAEPDIEVDGIQSLGFWSKKGKKLVEERVLKGSNLGAFIRAKLNFSAPTPSVAAKTVDSFGFYTPATAPVSAFYSESTYQEAQDALYTALPTFWKGKPDKTMLADPDQIISDEELTEVRSYAEKNVLDKTTSKMWRVSISYTPGRVDMPVAQDHAAQTAVYNALLSGGVINPYAARSNAVFTAEGQTVEIIFDELEAGTEELTYTSEGIELTDAAPYGIIAMPWADTQISVQGKDGGSFSFKNSKAAAYAAAMAMSQTSVIYDCQILPFCPLKNAQNADGVLRVLVDTVVTDTPVTPLKLLSCSGGFAIGTAATPTAVQTRAMAFSVLEPSRRIYIPEEEPQELGEDAAEIRVKATTEMWRITAPNGNGTFEFTPQLNGGVTGYNAYVTLKPFTPYIHVAPVFGGLYGTTFDDYRGMTVGGSMSLSRSSSAWENYKLQNVNFENAFNRQIESLEFSQKMGIVNQLTGAAGGVLSAAAMGGAAGGLASTAGAFLDLGMTAASYAEAVDLRQDLERYRRGNIQAAPMSLSRVSAFDANFSIWPKIEKYSASQEEQEALRRDINMRGITVDAAFESVRSSVFWENERRFVAAELYRLDGLGDDYTVAAACAAEMRRGVYVHGVSNIG